ncbi:hypothetical protein [Paracoccus pacificus]|uniref:Peptidase propeptide and YPEB domain-containing protein n=1 Tax=Paracoccus pacificus TaxID=1463598 RepID=A0ABW4R5S6_9RHOB
MLTNTFKTGLVVLKISALTALAGTTAMAQSPTVVTTPPAAETALIPAEGTDAKTPVGTIEWNGLPTFKQAQNDQAVAEALTAQGFTGIHIQRSGSLMTVDATREGKDIKLEYNLVDGTLIRVNGERILTGKEGENVGTGGNANASASDDTSGGEGTDGEGTDGEGTDGGTDGSGTDGTGTDGSGTDGGTDGSGTDSGTDAGGDTSGSDTGSDTGSDSSGGDSSDGSSGGDSSGGAAN